MSNRKDMQELVRYLRRLPGVEVSMTGKGHWAVRTKLGVVFMPFSPSDIRSIRNCHTKLEQIGITGFKGHVK